MKMKMKNRKKKKKKREKIKILDQPGPSPPLSNLLIPMFFCCIAGMGRKKSNSGGLVIWRVLWGEKKRWCFLFCFCFCGCNWAVGVGLICCNVCSGH